MILLRMRVDVASWCILVYTSARVVVLFVFVVRFCCSVRGALLAASLLVLEQKSVLVSVGGRSRVVSFCTGVASEKSTLTAAVKATFRDLLSAKQDFFLQVKDDDWGGAFVELQEDQTIPDKAVIEAVIVQKCSEVLYIIGS